MEGTYAWVSGPSYETPAEGRFLRNAGADVVGMSTIPEVVVAREEGMNVMVMSLVTNFVVIPESYRSIRDEVDAEVSVLVTEASVILMWFSSLQVNRFLQPLQRWYPTRKSLLLVKKRPI